MALIGLLWLWLTKTTIHRYIYISCNKLDLQFTIAMAESEEVAVIRWSEVLTRFRSATKRARHQVVNDGDDNNELPPYNTAETWVGIWDEFRAYFPAVYEQLQRYYHVRLCKQQQEEEDSSTLSSSDTVERNINNMKETMLETRNALRFGLACLSVDDEATRKLAQKEAVVCEWHESIFRILCHRKQCRAFRSPGGDCGSECQSSSARCLCNMVTANAETAAVVASCIPLSPSDETVTSRIRESTTADGSTQSPTSSGEPNWVDAVLSCGSVEDAVHRRDTLAAIIATLHNCVAILPTTTFAEEVASNALLISTLLRQLIRTDRIKDSLYGNGTTETGRPTNDDTDGKHNRCSNDDADSVSTWTRYLFDKLTRFGLLEKTYLAAGGGGRSVGDVKTVLPEQLILLYCVRSEFEAESASNGPVNGDSNRSDLTRSCKFLANLYTRLTRIKSSDHDDDVEETDLSALRETAIITILDTLASILSMDFGTVVEIRRRLGGETDLLQQTAQDLGRHMDIITIRNNGLKAREMNMTEEEQRTVTVLVRILGNLCYHCRRNQDLLRNTIVPFTMPSQQQQQQQQRNAIHVLLSCTAFSHCCLTLREWVVIAIRNAFEDNESNQAVVAQLEAQQPVQSAALTDMGIRINLDQRGTVSVAPLDRVAEAEDGGT